MRRSLASSTLFLPSLSNASSITNRSASRKSTKEIYELGFGNRIRSWLRPIDENKFHLLQSGYPDRILHIATRLDGDSVLLKSKFNIKIKKIIKRFPSKVRICTICFLIGLMWSCNGGRGW